LRRVHLNITESCNQNCLHCGVVRGAKREEELSKQEILSLIEKLVQLGTQSLAITGGEPFLREDLFEIIGYASQRMNTILSTNATLITPDMAKTLSRYKLTIQISLDGSNPEVHDKVRGEGSFAKTIKGIEYIKKEGMENFHLCVTVTRLNVTDSISILSLAREMGIKGVRFLPLQKLGNASDNWLILALSSDEQVQFYRCLYGEVIHRFPELKISAGLQGFSLQDTDTGMWCQIGRSLAITSRGDLYPCPLLTDEQFFLGNLREGVLEGIDYSRKRERLVRDYLNRTVQIEECKSCDWRGFCRGACPASIYLIKGSHLVVDGLCQLRNELYESLLFSCTTPKGAVANDVCC
jgi:radical SAM protein with 4Fe4S-binding SPASM domain